MSKKHCMFQYYTGYTYLETKQHENTGLITWEKAIELWNKYKDQVVEEIEDEISKPEMCIWTGCEDEFDYRNDAFHVDQNTKTDNGRLVEITIKEIDPSKVNMGEPVFEKMEDNTPTRDDLLEASKPLMKFINEFHPHHTIIVSHDTAELLESQMMNSTDEFIKDYSLGGGLGSRELLIDNLVLELGEVLNTEYGTDGPDFNNAIAGAIRQQIENPYFVESNEQLTDIQRVLKASAHAFDQAILEIRQTLNLEPKENINE